MNVETLILTLKSIPYDNHKNLTLKSVISLVDDIKWANIANIISCYSDDNLKMEAFTIILSDPIRKKLGQCIWESNYVADIYHQFYFPIKIEAIKLLDKCTSCVMPRNIFLNVIKDISSDSDKAEAVRLILICGTLVRININNIAQHVLPLCIIIDNIVQNVLPLISEDCNKIKVLTLIAQQNITRQKKFNESDLKFAVQNITSDSAKIECIKLFLEKEMISCTLLLEICHTFSSDSAKCDCILEFAEKIFPIVNRNEFCRALAAEISDSKYYLKVTNRLNIDDFFVQAHKPENKSQVVQTQEPENKQIIMSNRCIFDDNPNNRPGVSLMNRSTITSESHIIVIETYSDGSIYQMMHFIK